VHSDLARALVAAGFTVAMPEHRGDNARDPSDPGPRSWKVRPAEVSRAIDAVGTSTRFAPLLALDRVGMYGMSAGGHTALTLAGGRWSPAQLRSHCDAHLQEDFQTCVGLATHLTGGMLDGLKTSVALRVIRYKLKDEGWYTHDDPRIRAVVAGVPYAVDFDMASLAQPRVPLALVTAARDKWLLPRFHSDRVLAACRPRCELLANMPDGGHGALLSPPVPAGRGGALLTELLADPPGFDRAQLPAIDQRIAAFFRQHLLP
jgi:predicted dienelactone hydrolase